MPADSKLQPSRDDHDKALYDLIERRRRIADGLEEPTKNPNGPAIYTDGKSTHTGSENSEE